MRSALFILIAALLANAAGEPKTAILFAGAGSGAERYGNNTQMAARYFLERGYQVKILAGVYERNDAGWEFLESPEFKGKVQFTNLYEKANDAAGVERVLNETVQSSRGDLHFFVTDHGKPQGLVVDNKEMDIPYSALESALSRYRKDHPNQGITLMGVQCYAGQMHSIAEKIGACASAGIDAEREHASDVDQGIALHAKYFLEAPRASEADLDGDGKASLFESHYHAKLHDWKNSGLNGISSVEFARAEVKKAGGYSRPGIDLNWTTLDGLLPLIRSLREQVSGGADCPPSNGDLGEQIRNVQATVRPAPRLLTEEEANRLPEPMRELHRRQIGLVKETLARDLPALEAIVSEYLEVRSQIERAKERRSQANTSLHDEVQKLTGCDVRCGDLIWEKEDTVRKYPQLAPAFAELDEAMTQIVKLESRQNQIEVETSKQTAFRSISLVDDFYVTSRFLETAAPAAKQKFERLYRCEAGTVL